MAIPTDEYRQKQLLRSLLSVRLPGTIGDEYRVGGIAFCWFSRGVFGSPQREAAGTAIGTAKGREKTGNKLEVIFNVFKNEDDEIRREYLG